MAPRAWYGAFLALTALALLPIWLPVAPPFFDVPNHLARATILARRASSPFYRGLFDLNWRVIPNLTMDVVLSGLVRIMPPILAAKAFLSAIVLVLTGSFAALHRQVHGRRSWAGLAGFTLVYTLSFFMGFMNFALGLGLAFASTAVWGSLREAPAAWRLVATAVLLLLTFFTHLLAFGIAILFGLLVWGCDERGRRRRTVAEWALLIVPAVLLYVLLSPTRGEAGSLVFREPIYKLAAIVNLWRSGVIGLDAVVAPMFLVGVGFLAGGSRRSAPRFARPLVLTCAALFLIAPFGGRTTQVLDSRLPILIAAALLLAVSPAAETRWRSRVGYVLLGGGIAVQTVGLAASYRRDDGDVAELLDVYRSAPPGSYVFVGVAEGLGRRENGPYLRRHANDAGYAAAVNEAFVSDLFSLSAQQPLLYNAVGSKLAMVVAVAGDTRRPIALIQAARARLAAQDRGSSPAYAHYAAPDDVTPLPVSGARLLVAHPGLGIYRLDPSTL